MEKYLLQVEDGRFVSSAGASGLQLVDRCGDDAVWVRSNKTEDDSSEDDAFCLAAAIESATSARVTLRECSVELRQAVEVLPAPGELPSEYLRQLRRQGYVLIDNILSSEESATVRRVVFDEMDAQAKSEGARGAGAWDFVRTCPLVLRFHTHPIMLWVIGEYLGTRLLRAAHPPVPRVAEPSISGSGYGGWVRVCSASSMLPIADHTCHKRR